MASKCETSGCSRPGIAVAYFVDPDEEVDYCQDCVLRQQRRGDPPAAVVWKKSKVSIKIAP